ncbi:hypothetical protein HNR45_000416 [Negativicoccus succinicivorans]|uniref:Uncharacterized protein n=1 Tax=Negativicoccus succinicivorans TaxID=620903 RepID=A0A841R0Q8_9FIRM|nr:hypothetical protein [Negativicoccus succinicivorans]MBB6477386.1 hypothetical protein [Negativicoccus succinicivorans]
MSLSRDELVRRVETARRWLEQAEHSFHDETPLKGELNLLLAQAEMQKLREDRGMSRQWQRWQRALALVTALVMVSGFGWWWQKDDDAPAPVTAPATVVKTVPLEHSATWPPPTVSQTSQPTPAVSTAVPETSAPAVHAPPPVKTAAAAPTVQLAPDEMQAVVSDAAKVLRTP